jgi:polyisoprenyl-phosphate glycosyltransferase
VGFGIAATMFLVGGMLLLCLGVLGEYLGRVYDEVRSRPLSIINDVYYTPAIAAHGITKYKEANSSIEYGEAEPVIAFKMRVG